MDFNAWLAAKGFDAEVVNGNAVQKATLQAAWRAEQNPAPAPTPAPAPSPTPTPTPAPAATSFDDKMKAIEAENERVEYIRSCTESYAQTLIGNGERLKQLRELCDTAIADKKTDARAFDLAMMRFRQGPPGPMFYSPSKPQMTNDVIEAAVCMTHGLPNVEKSFSEQTLEAANKNFRRGLSLRRLFLMGAKSNGFTGDESDFPGVCRAIVRNSGEMYAGVGPSTGVQVPGILSNIANKFIVVAFMNVDQSWRGIAKIRAVNDFKQTTTYRMSGNNTFLRVSPSGEIKHGALSETSYTNQAKMFGRMLGISYEDYVNDDLGAFVSVNQELARGAADAVSNIFWANWLDDALFFPTDKSLLNYDDGATDSVLSLAGLDNAEAMFMLQTKPDGTPLGATPKILLVPSSLKNTALTLMQSQITNMATSSVALTGNANIFAGRYMVVSSPYLSRTSLRDENGVLQTVTGSSTAWYLLADPMDIPCIEVVFLFGKDVPTIETGDFEFDRLGLATRATFAFGVNKQEYRGGVKLKGAA